MSTSTSGSTRPGVFGRQINVQHGRKVKHKSELFPDGHLSFMITGASGTGKSCLLLNIIPNITGLSQLIICSRVHKNATYDALSTYCDNNDIEYELITDPISGEATIESMLSTRREGTATLVVFDDFGRLNSSRADKSTMFQNDISRLMRNYGCYSVYITQSFTDMSTLTRNNSNVKITFIMHDTHSIRAFKDSFISNGFGNEQEFNYLYNLLKKQHSFLMLVSPNKIYYHTGSQDNAPIEFKRVDGKLVRHINQVKKNDDSDSEDEDLQSVFEKKLKL